ncbi:MAG TPA: hypothetical protein VMX54_00965 [Vicinamibacteria bacterium]|nr:hypothetical protein [Vicinamibacteria bacterium]
MRSRPGTVWTLALAVAVTAGGAAAVAAGAAAATAGTKQSKRVELFQATSWNGKPLPAGEYKIVWQENGSDLKVTVMNGHQVAAEGRGRLEERPAKARSDAVISRADGSGGLSLAELQLAGKKEVLIFVGS